MGEGMTRLADPTEEPARYLAERRERLTKMTEAASPSLASQAAIELVRFCDDITAARAEGARRERERVRGLPRTSAMDEALYRANQEAQDEAAWRLVVPRPDPAPVAAWSALLAAITEGE